MQAGTLSVDIESVAVFCTTVAKFRVVTDYSLQSLNYLPFGPLPKESAHPYPITMSLFAGQFLEHTTNKRMKPAFPSKNKGEGLFYLVTRGLSAPGEKKKKT